MNHIHRSIWNCALGAWVAAPETARSNRRGRSRSSGRQSGVQVGTDLWGNPNWRTGVYVGQLEGDLDVTGFARGAQNYATGSNDLRSQFLAG